MRNRRVGVQRPQGEPWDEWQRQMVRRHLVIVRNVVGCVTGLGGSIMVFVIGSYAPLPLWLWLVFLGLALLAAIVTATFAERRVREALNQGMLDGGDR